MSEENSSIDPSQIKLQRNVNKGLEQKVDEVENVKNHHFNVQEDNGGETPQTTTPARPNDNDVIEQQNPQKKDRREKEDASEQTIFKKRNIILGIIALVVVVLLIGLIVMIAKRDKSKISKMKEQYTVMVYPGKPSVSAVKVEVQDSQIMNSQKSVPIYAQKVISSNSPGVNRNLQESKYFSYYTLKDVATNTSITIFSKALEFKIYVDISSILQFVLNNQPRSQEDISRNLQQIIPQATKQEKQVIIELVFYQVQEKIAQKIKDELKKRDPNVKVSQVVTHNIKYNKQINSYQFVTSKKRNGNSEEYISFFEGANTPVIKNLKDQNQVAEAAVTVVLGVINRAKELFQKKINDIEKVSGVRLPESNTDFTKLSTNIDTTVDLMKLCPLIEDNTVQCHQKALNSGVINIAIPNNDYVPRNALSISYDA